MKTRGVKILSSRKILHAFIHSCLIYVRMHERHTLAFNQQPKKYQYSFTFKSTDNKSPPLPKNKSIISFSCHDIIAAAMQLSAIIKQPPQNQSHNLFASFSRDFNRSLCNMLQLNLSQPTSPVINMYFSH